MSIDYKAVRTGEKIILGHQDDNDAHGFKFEIIQDTRRWYGAGGTWHITIAPPAGDPYPIPQSQIDEDDDYLYITITENDVYEMGTGKLYIRYDLTDRIHKTISEYLFTVLRVPYGERTANESMQTYIGEMYSIEDKVLEAQEHAPYIDEDTNHWMVWNTETGEYDDTEVDAKGIPGEQGEPGEPGEDGEDGTDGVSVTGATITDDHLIITLSDGTEIDAGAVAAGTFDHSELTNRDASSQHPISAITGLQDAIDDKQDALSAAQLSAVNSGVTQPKVGTYDEHVSDSDIHVTGAQKNEWSGKQDDIAMYTPSSQSIGDDDYVVSIVDGDLVKVPKNKFSSGVGSWSDLRDKPFDYLGSDFVEDEGDLKLNHPTVSSVSDSDYVLVLVDGVLKKVPKSAIGGGGSGMENPMTASGDIIIGGASGIPTRLAKGANGKVLKMVNDVPTWSNESGGASFWDELLDKPFETIGTGLTVQNNALKLDGTIPTQLSQLSGDATHRTVTDTEKSTWNGKQNALTAGSGISIVGDTISATGGGGGSAITEIEESYTITAEDVENEIKKVVFQFDVADSTKIETINFRFSHGATGGSKISGVNLICPEQKPFLSLGNEYRNVDLFSKSGAGTMTLNAWGVASYIAVKLFKGEGNFLISRIGSAFAENGPAWTDKNIYPYGKLYLHVGFGDTLVEGLKIQVKVTLV